MSSPNVRFLQDPPIVFRRSDMESEKNDDNPDQTPVSEPPSMNQNGENLIIVSNTMPFILNATILY